MEAEQVSETVDETVPVEETTVVPETEEGQEPEVETPSKTFTQEELDATVGKRLARERRRWEREQKSVEPVVEAPKGDLNPDDFTDHEDYVAAKIQQGIAEALAKREASQVTEQFADREEEAMERYPDYADKVTNNAQLPITEIMADVIKSSDVGPDVAYHLGNNPKEAARIAKLAPLLQAKELGRLEAALTAKPPPQKQKSNAPPPISPIKPISGGEKHPADMTDAEYMAWSAKNRRKR